MDITAPAQAASFPGGDPTLVVKGGSDKEGHREGNATMETGHRGKEQGKEDLQASNTHARPGISPRLRTAPKAVPARFSQLLSDSALPQGELGMGGQQYMLVVREGRAE